MAKLDPERAKKSALLQVIGGFLMLTASGMSAQSGASIWQTILGAVVGAYFLGFGIYRWTSNREGRR